MKGFNGSKPITDETRRKMAESARRTLNGYKKGHLAYFLKHSQETKDKLRMIALADGRKPDFTGRKHTDESKKKMSIRGRANPSRYWLGKDRSAIFTEEYRWKMSIASKRVVAEGRHNFYVDGRTPVNKKIRMSLEYSLWREAVYNRDDYTCQDCGQRGGRLEAHHDLSFSQYPDLRFEVLNGITLCRKCHTKTYNYGRRALPSLAGSGTM